MKHLEKAMCLLVFCFLLASSIIQPSAVIGQNKETQKGTAHYESLVPDQFLDRWLVLGPIPVFESKPNPEDQETQKQAFVNDALAPITKSIKAGDKQKIGAQTFAWQALESENHIVDLTEAFGDSEFVIAYAWAEINAAEAKTALLALGSDDGVKVLLNGKLIHENWIGRPVNQDDDLFPAEFKKGKNHLLLKIQNMQLDWGFCLRPIGPESFPEKLSDFANRGNLDAMNLLLSHGAEVNARNKAGLTALHSAKISGREQAAKLLIEKGADASVEMPSKEKLIDAIFEKASGDNPGAAVLVAQNGSILFEKGYGLANVENNLPVTLKTKFRIGSITKQFIAAAILKLEEAGKLSVSDPLSKFIPDFPRGDSVTVYHLLTHTSGIHSYTNEPDFLQTAASEIKPDSLIAQIKRAPYDFDPGEKFAYNNSAYFMLGYIIEKVSGKSYAGFLKETFFDPLEMRDSGVHTWSAILPHEATGYSYIDNKFQKALNWDMSRAGGAGALYSTVKDLYLWNEALFNGKVLSDASMKAAFTPALLSDGTQAPAFGAGYGYGWAISDFRGMQELAHSGGLHGFLSFLTRLPEEKFTVTILCNSLPTNNINPTAAAHRIAEIYLWEKLKPQDSFAADTSIDPNTYDDYVGRYEYQQGAILTITRDGGRLFAQLTGQPNFEIFPKSATEFFWKVVDAQIDFVHNEAGDVTHAVHHQGGQTFEAPRLNEEKPADIDPAIYDIYVGEYQFNPNAVITVSKEDSRIFVQLTGQPRFEIYPRTQTEFFLTVVKADIEFVNDESGKVTSLILNQGGMKQTATRRSAKP
jgi:CubicO group peptidase (beta-lactamase class C family)